MAKHKLGLLQVILSFFQDHCIGTNLAHAFEGLIKQNVYPSLDMALSSEASIH